MTRFRLRGEHPNVKVYAVISDLGASGAYYIASAADQIYADKASLVGSIGVTAASFGFVGTMEKLGVERRVYTSGEHKSFLDPFQPQKPEETQFWQQVLDTTHKQFIDSVKRARRPAQGRGASGAVLGSGLVRRTGIAARFDRRSGQCQLWAREVVKEKKIEDYTVQESPFDRFAKKFGASVAERLALWMGWQGPVLR